MMLRMTADIPSRNSPTHWISVMASMTGNTTTLTTSLIKNNCDTSLKVRGMDKKEKQDHHMAKAVQYGEKYDAMPKIGAVNTSEEEILDKYISLNAPFLQKNIKVETKNGPRYFDAYAYWNGCHYVAEVKRLHKWTPSRVQGVRIFSTNATSSLRASEYFLS